MHDPIVSIAQIEQKAYSAFENGQTLDDNPFPPSSMAAATWRDTFSKLEFMFNKKAKAAHGVA